jgi:hypothetical protein
MKAILSKINLMVMVNYKDKVLSLKESFKMVTKYMEYKIQSRELMKVRL